MASPFERQVLPGRLREALAGPLPGAKAHAGVLPAGVPPRSLPAGVSPAEAAVLLALHPDPESARVVFPLIRRPDSMMRHAGQIGLPGGVFDPGEDTEACALREAFEEIGIDPCEVQVLGRLTPIVIPVSAFRVETIVGWLDRAPRYSIRAEEVTGLHLADPDELAATGPTAVLEREQDGRILRFPAYSVDGQTVWGATALILAEFLEVWRSTRT